MRKFWKLGLIFGVVAFMAGCSNLWDYVPPPRVDNAPVSSDGASGGGGGGGGGGGKPSGGGGGGPTLNTLKFYVNDGSGEAKEVKVTVSGNTATIAQIKAAFSRLPSSSTPRGFTVDNWYESNSTTVASGSSYSNGGVFVIGYKANPSGDQNGYTVSFAKDSTDGQRKFVTTPKTDGDKTLAEILGSAGLTGTAYNPPVPTDWTFRGWAKPDDTNTKIDPQTDTTTYPSDTNFVAVYEVPYKINVGGVPYTVNVPVTGPNKGATWEQIKAAALALPDSTIPAAAKDEIRNNTWGAKKPSDTDPSGFGKDEQFPANTDFSETIQFKYTIYDINGKKVEVDFGPLPSSTVKTLADIIAAAKKNNPSADFGSGITDKDGNNIPGNKFVNVTKWNDGTNPNITDITTSILPGATITPKEKELTYRVNKVEKANSMLQDVKITVNDADPINKQLKDILATSVISNLSAFVPNNVNDYAPNKGTDVFMGWKVTKTDGTVIVDPGEISSNADLFSPGTIIEPNWIINGAGGAEGPDDRVLDKKTSEPDIGDGITVNGEIIKHDDINPAIIDTVLGYIYKVDKTNSIVHVVAKEIASPNNDTSSNPWPQKEAWSKTGCHAYYGTELNGIYLHTNLGLSNEDGYDTWLKVYQWNPGALYANYRAIKLALCYPVNQDSKDENNVSLWPANNTKVDSIVNGKNYDERWYLPSVAELKLIYGAKDVLWNWDADTHKGNGGKTGLKEKAFWSINVSDTETSRQYHNAYYVDFNDIDTTDPLKPVPNHFENDKGQNRVGGTGNDIYVIPVARFKYK